MTADLSRGVYVRLLAAVYSSMFLIRVAFGITVVAFAEYIDVGDFAYSLIVTASPVLELITVIFAGVLIDRYGRRGILLTGLVLGAISVYGLALTKNSFLLAGVNALHGIAAALILVTTLAIIATFAPPERRGREMGLFNLANLFGWIAGFVVGFVMLDLIDNVAYTFVIAGTLAAIGIIPVNQWVTVQPGDEPRVKTGHEPPSMRELVMAAGNPTILLLTLPWLIVFMLVGAFITFLPRVAGEALELSGATTALGIMGLGVLIVASQLVWGRLADRYGREVIMFVGATGFALFMGLIVYAFFETGSEDSAVVFRNVMAHWIALTVFLFTALAFAPAGLAAIADEAKEGAQGTTMSLYSLTLSLGFIVGPPLLGAISEAVGGTGMVIYFAALALLLVGLVLARIIRTRVHASRAEATQR